MNGPRDIADGSGMVARMVDAGKRCFSAVFIAVCRQFNSREVTVAASTPEQEREYYKYEQVGPRGMSLHTENFLRGNLLRSSLERSPNKILDTIDSFFRISGDSVYPLIAADVCRYFAGRETSDDEERIKFHLAAFRYSFLAFSNRKHGPKELQDLYRDSLVLQEVQIMNEAIAGIFCYLRKKNLLDSSMFCLQGIAGTEFIFERPTFRLSVPREAVADFSLCSSYSVRALRLINRHSGYGVPLVAKINTKELSRSLRTPPGLTIPVTLFFRVTLSEQKISLFPIYQDTSLKEDFQLENSFFDIPLHWPLARDFSTPLACFMNDITQRNLLADMLNPMKYEESAGLYMVEPYRPEKIPVVFVHGLMSSPETWGQMLNSLKYDPEIRKKYQFWFYSYSTGVPVLYSAGNLCRELLKAREEFCTTAEATGNFNRMVLVGHSMGGMIVRQLLQKTPGQAIETLTGQSWEKVCRKLLPEDQQLIEHLFIFPPLDFVRRAVFMAVPHRGAAMAQKQIAKLGIRLIQLPGQLLGKKENIIRIWKTLMPKEKMTWRKDSFLTGIDNLNPKSIFVRWAGDSQMRQDVMYHSIIGNREAENVPGGSDGIVPYLSSHLDNVASECIVQSDHSVHRNPAAIRELLRILLLHLRESFPRK